MKRDQLIENEGLRRDYNAGGSRVLTYLQVESVLYTYGRSTA